MKKVAFKCSCGNKVVASMTSPCDEFRKCGACLNARFPNGGFNIFHAKKVSAHG